MIRKLREAETMAAAGQGVGAICQKPAVSEATLHRWQRKYRGMGDGDIKRMKALEEENRRLKKAVAELVLDKQIIEEVMLGKD